MHSRRLRERQPRPAGGEWRNGTAHLCEPVTARALLSSSHDGGNPPGPACGFNAARRAVKSLKRRRTAHDRPPSPSTSSRYAVNVPLPLCCCSTPPTWTYATVIPVSAESPAYQARDTGLKPAQRGWQCDDDSRHVAPCMCHHRPSRLNHCSVCALRHFRCYRLEA